MQKQSLTFLFISVDLFFIELQFTNGIVYKSQVYKSILTNAHTDTTITHSLFFKCSDF